jgi:hypothetical protein
MERETFLLRIQTVTIERPQAFFCKGLIPLP